MIERPRAASVRAVAVRDPAPGEVLVRSAAAGVCRGDLKILSGGLREEWVSYPCIPGHEWAGTVVATGDGVAGLAAGDRVVAEGAVPCGRCRACKAGDTHLCPGHETLGFTRPGGCAEMVVVPQHVVHHLPPHASLDAGVLVEPASCVLRALERVRPRAGESVAVVGTGTLGLLALRLARLYSPGLVVAVGIRAAQLELARALGADATVDWTRSDAEARALRALDGGADVVVEAAGSVYAIDSATRIARVGGRVALLGIVGEGRTLALPADRIVGKDLDVAGSLSYTSATWTRVVRLLETRAVSFDGIVTHRFELGDFRAAFAAIDRRDGPVGKVLLEHAP